MSRMSRIVASAAPPIVEDADPVPDPDVAAAAAAAAAPPPPALPLPPAAARGTISVEYRGFLDNDPRKNS